ncbi:MAG: NAD(P)/FAD-dependent oxidoreductase [Vicinamibacterales bacterium]
MFDAEVIVVGAGPAGATAARRLAAAGVRVRLLERHRFPRNKPCGGGISMRVLDRFPYLRPALGRIATHTACRLRLEGPGGGVLQLASEGPAVLLVRRVEFDALLASLAAEAGADLIEGVAVRGVSAEADHVALRAADGTLFRAPIVIAADGVHGVVARRLGFLPRWAAASVAIDLMEETPNDVLRAADPGELWVSYGHEAADGYAYIFPKKDHVNVGVGALLSDYRGRECRPPAEVQRALVAHLVSRGLLAGRSSRTHFTPSMIPVGGPLPVTARGRVLLAGDAGGFVNGYTAEGIYYGMVSGDLAARAVIDTSAAAGRSRWTSGGSVAGGRDHPAVAAYADGWRREIGTELRDSVLIRKYLFFDPARVDGVIRGGADFPEVADLIVGYAMGRVPYQVARRRVLRRFPLLAFKLLRSALIGGARGHVDTRHEGTKRRGASGSPH